MTKDEIKQLKNYLQQIVETDTVGMAAELLPESEFDSTELGVFTPTTFLSNLERVIEQFLVPLDSEEGLFFLSTFNEPETFSGTVVQATKNLAGQIKGKNWPAAATFLLYLIRYQMQMGIWDRSETRVHAGNDLKALEVLKSIQAQNAKQKGEIETLRAEHEKLNKLVSAKQKELNEIENLRDSARTNRGEIETILKEAAKNKEALETLVATQNSNKAEIKKALEEIVDRQTSTNKRLEEIDTLHKEAEKLQKEILDKRSEIDRLTGRAADGSLGHTFKARFAELEKRVDLWMRIIIGAFALGVTWFAASFYIIPVPSGDPWVYFFFLTLKLTPSLVLIFWALQQYGRERSFLEEYAFKSAVALTVHAYADELASEKYSLEEEDFGDSSEYRMYLKDREKDRKELIKETVDRLYRDPMIHKEHSSRWLSLRPKAAKEVIAEVRNLVRESKDVI